MSTSLLAQIPLLKGDNYFKWAKEMKAYFRSQGVWALAIEGSKPKDAPSAADAAEKARVLAAQQDYAIKNEQALGTMFLKCTDSVRIHIADKITGYGAWSALKDAYSKTGASVIYADFKQAVEFKLSGAGSPAEEHCETHRA